jgi:enoyl-CoA hydratase/carnithine racemase
VSDLVRVDRDGAVAVITIAHPPANALSSEVIGALRAAVADIGRPDSGVRAAILTGQGEKVFAAGADVTEFATLGPENVGAGRDLTLEMEACPVPLIAAVNGIAFGGGCELVMACDVRVGSTTARFGQPEINLGIIPGWGGTQRLPRLIGATRAMSMLLTGNPIDGRTAFDWGLLTAVVEPGELMDTARTMAATIAGKAPLAVQATKRAVYEGRDAASMAEALAVEQREFAAVFATEDAREGVTAFLAKRAAEWKAR